MPLTSLRANAGRDALVYFAAKEAFYKCQYPLTHTFLDFLDVELEIDWDASLFRIGAVRRLSHQRECFDRMQGRFNRRDELVLCGVELR